ncbi:transposase [Streptomyces mirabilis]|uniref:transposase n=1 Tax=Streptomyces mirabilis TaxID=68239 RepID=UPI0037F1D6BB
MRDYVRGLLGPVGRKNSRRLAEYAGHAIPHGLQHLLSHSRWDAEGLRDHLQAYGAERLGCADDVLILDDTGFVMKRTTSAGAQRQATGRLLRARSPHACSAAFSVASGVSPYGGGLPCSRRGCHGAGDMALHPSGVRR